MFVTQLSHSGELDIIEPRKSTGANGRLSLEWGVSQDWRTVLNLIHFPLHCPNDTGTTVPKRFLTYLLSNPVSQSQQQLLAKSIVLLPAACQPHSTYASGGVSSLFLFQHSQSRHFPTMVHNHKNLLSFCPSSPPLRIKFPPPFVQSVFFSPLLPKHSPLPLYWQWKHNILWTKDSLPLLSTTSRVPRPEEQELKQSQVVRSLW